MARDLHATTQLLLEQGPTRNAESMIGMLWCVHICAVVMLSRQALCGVRIALYVSVDVSSCMCRVGGET